MKAFNNDSSALVQYLMIVNGTYEKLAEKQVTLIKNAVSLKLFIQALAIQGLNPKINLWSTGSDSSNSNIYNAIASLGKVF